MNNSPEQKGKVMDTSYTAAVITVSDQIHRGEKADLGGPSLCEFLSEDGWEIVLTETVPDEMARIEEILIRCADEIRADLIVTAGGTGFSRKDVTPEATLAVIDREVRGIPEAMRCAGMQFTPNACLSRGAAGLRGNSLIVNVPGSAKASRENLTAVLPAIKHGIRMMHTFGDK